MSLCFEKDEHLVENTLRVDSMFYALKASSDILHVTNLR